MRINICVAVQLLANPILGMEPNFHHSKGGRQKLLSGFFPQRGWGVPPIPLSFFGHNDFPNPEITNLYQFYDQKALFKVPKICNINFCIENDPTPHLTLFQKSIRFGSWTLP